MPEDGVGISDSVAASESKVKSSAHAVSADGGVGRGREVRNRMHQALPHGSELIRGGSGQIGDFVQIGSGRKKVLIPSNDEWFRRNLACEFYNRFSQCAHPGTGQPVGFIPGKPEDGCRVPPLELVEDHEVIIQEPRGQKIEAIKLDIVLGL